MHGDYLSDVVHLKAHDCVGGVAQWLLWLLNATSPAGRQISTVPHRNFRLVHLCSHVLKHQAHQVDHTNTSAPLFSRLSRRNPGAENTCKSAKFPWRFGIDFFAGFCAYCSARDRESSETDRHIRKTLILVRCVARESIAKRTAALTLNYVD